MAINSDYTALGKTTRPDSGEADTGPGRSSALKTLGKKAIAAIGRFFSCQCFPAMRSPVSQVSQVSPVSQVSQVSSEIRSLEAEFGAKATAIDLDNEPHFKLYLAPNEWNVDRLDPHLQTTTPGLIVSTGTERSFFDLLKSALNCRGLVVVDIHPFVKAYIDFNVLLLRIAKSRAEYERLTTLDRDTWIWDIESRVKEIETILSECSDLSPVMKDYYRQHLKTFARIYFQGRYEARASDSDSCYGGIFTDWRDAKQFKTVRYHEDDALFGRLQQYAKSGNIIAVVGSIEDLQFLNGRTISLLDISNIADYTTLNFKMQSNPRILFTYMNNSNHGDYYSNEYQALTPEEAVELKDILQELYDAGDYGDDAESYWEFAKWLKDLMPNVPRYYCKEFLYKIRELNRQVQEAEASDPG